MSHQKYEVIEHCTPSWQGDMPWDSWSWDRCSGSFSFRAACTRTASSNNGVKARQNAQTNMLSRFAFLDITSQANVLSPLLFSTLHPRLIDT